LLDRLLLGAIVFTLVVAGAFVFVSFPPSQGNLGGTQLTNHGVSPEQIVSGGPPPDGIPSIDNPKFVTVANATFLSDDPNYGDWVIGIRYNVEQRAYPLQILVWHEIVNDVVGGTPVAITYCPLCYSTAAFIRAINGTAVQFGTSGKLYNNNLVMYDRLTKSLWSQIWGEAIAGDLKGSKLQKVPIDVIAWGEWKKLYPNTLVLSRQTGYSRPYNDDPYGAYYTTDQIWFPLSHLDRRLPPKTVVLGLTLGVESKAYPIANLKAPVVTDSLGGVSILLWRIGGDVRFFDPVVAGAPLHFTNANGTLVDSETHSTWNYEGVAISGPLNGKSLLRYSAESAFWFAWAAFYPSTGIYAANS
jgi:hypothetical protein